LFDNEAPASALIAAEVHFTAVAAAVGVRVAASHPATDGRYVVPMLSGSGWLRLNDWLDTVPLHLGADGLPAQLGTLLGRLHTCAPASDREPSGAAPDEWYDVPPAADGWPPMVDAALTADAAWAPDLAARLSLITAITALATPADTTAMVTCHRDLHPDNVLVIHDGTTNAGQLAVIDWDNVGPADPSRELVRVLLDWFFGNDTLDIRAVHDMLVAYRATGAPGRIAHDAFGLAISSRLSFSTVR
jgi:Ser/Thr protein kinase RdoA (MazF antagonist)